VIVAVGKEVNENDIKEATGISWTYNGLEHCCSTLLLKWHPLEHLDCSKNSMQWYKGVLFQVKRHIIFIYLVMH